MARTVGDLPRVRPGRVWKLVPTDEGLEADSGLVRVHLRAPRRVGAVHALADLVQAGTQTAETLAMLVFYTCGQDEAVTRSDLDLLFGRGVLDEEPDR